MSKFYGQAEAVANRIVDSFKSGNLPKALSPVFIHRDDDIPCRKWSWNNQLLTALAGFDDARGFRQWKTAGRSVKKGEKSFQILAPVTVKRTVIGDDGNESEGCAVIGFRSVAVFGYEQTEGKPLADREDEERFIDSLPLIEVARAWGLSVATYGGESGRALGKYRPGHAIALGVENHATWAHELMHAADDRLGQLTERGQHWRSETVAELGGAILLECIGESSEADLGGCWKYIEHYAKDAELEAVTACMKVLKRTCDAVALILDTAGSLSNEPQEALAAA
jgi:antirestriction protein ArdC